MDENELLDRLYSYAFCAAALVVAAFSLLSGSYLLALICAALLLCAGAFFSSGHIINNLLLKHSNIIAYYNEYKLSSTLLSLTRPEGNMHRSLSVAVLRSERASESSPEALRNLIEGMMEPFEFSIRMVPADKKRIVDVLDAKRRMKELQIAKMKPGKPDAVNSLRREIQVIESDMENIRKGGMAFDTVIRITAVAVAESQMEAARQSVRSLERLCDAFSATTKLECEILKGEALVKFMRWNS